MAIETEATSRTTCYLCGKVAKRGDLIRYTIRNYAHPRCFLVWGGPKALQKLTKSTVEDLPMKLVREFGLEQSAHNILEGKEPSHPEYVERRYKCQ